MAEETKTDFFADFRFASQEPLLKVQRQKCPKCGHNRSFYCYDCEVALTEGVPRVELPFEADIVHHPTERRSKSTSVHGALLAPEYCRVVEYPLALPAEGYDKETTVVLYPTETAKECKDLTADDIRRIKKVVLIDSQWQKANGMRLNPAIRDLPCMKLSNPRTAFWRYQSHGRDHLATIEALYYFAKEFAAAKAALCPEDVPQFGEHAFDNILWYFSHNFRVIQGYYNEHLEKNFLRIDNYIEYKPEAAEKKQELDAKKDEDA